MKHLGDITKISGYSVPAVDCIIGGSPCQDLSVAGKRAGLGGERSGLYMEQIRIVKELRDNDRRNGRSGVAVRPRYMVWENVPGAFSSNKAEDFRIVLEEIAKVCEENAVIPLPPSGKWTSSGCIVGEGWSVAWRVFDAQFWGVPQRRRRIALVADFGGQSAPEILFVRESVSGHLDESRTPREGNAADAEGGIGADDREGKCFGITAKGNGDVFISRECHTALSAGGGQAGQGYPCVVVENQDEVLAFHLTQDPIPSEQCTPCMGSGNPIRGQATIGVCYGVDAYNQCVTGNKAKTLTAMSSDTEHIPAVAYPEVRDGVVGTLDAHYSKPPGCRGGMERTMVVVRKDEACYLDGSQVVGTLTANNAGGNQRMPDKENFNCVIDQRYIVRRLTPLECERLQGYPDGWTDIGEWTDSKGKVHKTSDAARYKALGNSIALPPWKWVLKRLCACYERDATMASLFDGIGGFPYLWEQLNGKGSCLWASEIEEFPMAVTKIRIGE